MDIVLDDELPFGFSLNEILVIFVDRLNRIEQSLKDLSDRIDKIEERLDNAGI